ncbi:hypothetical protein O0544_18090 [Edwardsiella anguillarum]|nr:hypothetical protein [Edwardsiella anguillarum]
MAGLRGLPADHPSGAAVIAAAGLDGAQSGDQALNPTFLSFIGIVASLLLKVADERKAMENIPWSIIIMICGREC